jgi:iron complex outermembrane receptor protein
MYGSFVTRGAHAFGSYNKDRLSVSAFADYFGTDGTFRYLNNNGTPFNPSDDRWQTRENNVSNAVSGAANASYRINDKLNLYLRDTPFWRLQGVPGTGSIQAMHTSYETFRNVAEAGGEAGPWGPTGALVRFSLSDNLTLDRFSDPYGETGVGIPRIVKSTDNTLMLKGSVRFAPTEDQLFTIGAGAGWEIYTPTDELPVERSDGTSMRFSWFTVFEDTITLFGNILTITPALRIEGVADSYDYRPIDPAYPSPAVNSRTDTEVLPCIGMKVQPLAWLAIKLNTGLVARQPYFYEMFGESGAVTANPNLGPETGNNWDVGLVLSPPTLRFEYAYFQSRMHNLIQFMQNSQRTTIAINIGEAFISGHEFHASWSPHRMFTLSASYTYQIPLNLGPIPSQKGKQLPYRPRNNLFARPEFRWKWFAVWYEFNFVSGNFFDPANLLPTPAGVPPRYIHNAGISCALPKGGVTLAIEGKNLSNSHIEDFAGYPLPGISFFGSVTWKL